MGGKTGAGAVVEGIHAEGPIVATLGGLPPGENDMSAEEFAELLDMLSPGLRLMTISPSVDSKSEFAKIKTLLQRGVRPCLGHDTVATPSEILAALRLSSPGYPFHVTHTFNVQRFHHRDCGLANLALLSEWPKLPEYEGAIEPTIELIGDCAHVSPAVLKLAVTCKRKGMACFITDGIAEPLPGLKMMHTGRTSEVVVQNGIPQVVLTTPEQSGVLIGSCIMLLDAFKTAINILGLDVATAVEMCSCLPARIAGLSHIGTLDVGKRADILLFSDSLHLFTTVVNGEVVHSSQSVESGDQCESYVKRPRVG